jgi:uncharacterized oxidoreductase
MKMSDNTILITGGTSGIGLEMAAQLLALANTIIVTGRDARKLEEAQRRLPALHTIQSDVSDPQSIRSLHEQVVGRFPDLNVLINNAGIMRKINFHAPPPTLEDLTREINIDLVGPMQMVEQFLPHLKTKLSAAIVNVSSGLAFVPLPIAPVYCAAKAGIHSFTQSLRIQLKSTNVRVFELAPPGTNTALYHDDFTEEDVKGVRPMDLHTMVKHALEGLEKDTWEIRPGLSNVLRLMSRVAPQFMLGQLGRSVDVMLNQTKH